MSNHEAVTAAGEASIGNQCDFVGEAAANDRTGWAEHLTHAGSALGALITNDDDIPCPHLAAEYCGSRALLAIKHPRPAREGESLFARDLGNCTFGCHISIKNNQMTIFLNRI